MMPRRILFLAVPPTTFVAGLAVRGRASARTASAVAVEEAWAQPVNHDVGAPKVYLRLRNTGSEPAELVGAETAAAARVQIDETSMQFGAPRSRPHQGPVVVPPGGVVSFEPGGLQFVLLGPKENLGPGDRFPLTLRFADGTAQTVIVGVRGIGAGPTIGERDGHAPH